MSVLVVVVRECCSSSLAKSRCRIQIFLSGWLDAKQLKSVLEFLITLTYSTTRCMIDLQSEHLVGIIVGNKIPL